MSAAPTNPATEDRPEGFPSVLPPAGAASLPVLEREAVEHRTHGRSASEATAALVRRYPDSEPLVSRAVEAAYSFTLTLGRQQNDDATAAWLAARLAPRHRYVVTPGSPEGRWYFFDGARWRDDAARIELLRSIEREAVEAKDDAEDMYARASSDDYRRGKARDLRKIAAQLSKAGGKSAAIRVLAPHLALYASALDSHPHLVALADCTAHTRGDGRGRVRAHRAEDFLTKGLDASYRPELLGSNIEWHVFGLSMFDAETWHWFNLTLARWALDGHAPPFALVLAGETRTGKTTLVETVLALLGDDLGAAGSLAAFGDDTTGPNSARAALFGPRLVSMSEAGRTTAIASPFFKRYTSEGTVAVEDKYERQHSERPSALVVIDSNMLPEVDGADDAVMRRLWLVPFSRRFYRIDTEAGRAEFDAAVERGERPGVVDPTLGDRLKSRDSLDAILAWWLALLRDSPDADPTPPVGVQRATEAWRSQANPIAAYIEGRFEFDPLGEVALSEFSDEFRSWLAEYLPQRAADFRDPRQVARAIRDLPPRTLRIEKRGRSNVRTIIGLRAIEGGDE